MRLWASPRLTADLPPQVTGALEHLPGLLEAVAVHQDHRPIVGGVGLAKGVLDLEVGGLRLAVHRFGAVQVPLLATHHGEVVEAGGESPEVADSAAQLGGAAESPGGLFEMAAVGPGVGEGGHGLGFAPRMVQVPVDPQGPVGRRLGGLPLAEEAEGAGAGEEGLGQQQVGPLGFGPGGGPIRRRQLALELGEGAGGVGLRQVEARIEGEGLRQSAELVEGVEGLDRHAGGGLRRHQPQAVVQLVGERLPEIAVDPAGRPPIPLRLAVAALHHQAVFPRQVRRQLEGPLGGLGGPLSVAQALPGGGQGGVDQRLVALPGGGPLQQILGGLGLHVPQVVEGLGVEARGFRVLRQAAEGVVDATFSGPQGLAKALAEGPHHGEEIRHRAFFRDRRDLGAEGRVLDPQVEAQGVLALWTRQAHVGPQHQEIAAQQAVELAGLARRELGDGIEVQLLEGVGHPLAGDPPEVLSAG
ncbi:MAG: hypothetical protein AAGD06_12355 [Acidobacteriota bacterium]